MYGKITLGSAGTILVKLMIVIGNFGFSCVYLKVFGDFVETIIAAIIGDSTSDEIYLRPTTFIIIIFILLIPLVLSESTSILNIASVFGIFGLALFCLLMFFIFIEKLIHNELTFNLSMLWPQPINGKIEIISSLPTVILAFSFHFNLFPIYVSIRNRSNRIMHNSSMKSLLISFAIYFIVGILGYTMYTSQKLGNSYYGLQNIIIRNMKVDLDEMRSNLSQNIFMFFLYIIGISAFTFSCVLTLPLMFFTCKKHFLNLVLYCKKRRNKATVFSHKSGMSYKEKKGYSLILYLSVLILTLSVDNIMVLFNFIGSTSSSMISFILPGVFLGKLLTKNGMTEGKRTCYVVIAFGLVGIGSFYLPEIMKIVTKQ